MTRVERMRTEVGKRIVNAHRNPGTGLGIESGTLVAYDAANFSATVRYYDTLIPGIPVLSGVDQFNWQAGDELALVTFYPTQGRRRRGLGEFGILGRIVREGEGRGARLVVDDGDGSVVLIEAGRIFMQREESLFGKIETTNPEGESERVALLINPPFRSGDDDDNLLILEGRSPEVQGAFFALFQEQIHFDCLDGNIFFTPGREEGVQAFVTLAQMVFLEAADSNGDPLPSLNLGASGTTTKGTRTSFVTTSNAANTHLFTDSGRIAVSTSARRFKANIEDLPVDPAAVLRLRPRTWQDRGDLERNPQAANWHVGLIAEEAVEAGLQEFVDHDEQGQPFSIAYDRLAVALLSIVQQQQARLDALDGGVTSQALPSQRKPVRRSVDPVGRITPPAIRRTGRSPAARPQGTGTGPDREAGPTPTGRPT